MIFKAGFAIVVLIGIVALPLLLGEGGMVGPGITLPSVGTTTPATQPSLPTIFQPQPTGYGGSSYSYYVIENFDSLSSKFWIWRGDPTVTNGILTMTNGWLQSKSKYSGRTLTINLSITPPPPIVRVDPLFFGFADDFMKTYAAFLIENGVLFTYTATVSGIERSENGWAIPQGFHTYSISIYAAMGKRIEFKLDDALISTHTRVVPSSFMYVFVASYQCHIEIDRLRIEPRVYFRIWQYSTTTTSSTTTTTSTTSTTTTTSEREPKEPYVIANQTQTITTR